MTITLTFSHRLVRRTFSRENRTDMRQKVMNGEVSFYLDDEMAGKLMKYSCLDFLVALDGLDFSCVNKRKNDISVIFS